MIGDRTPACTCNAQLNFFCSKTSLVDEWRVLGDSGLMKKPVPPQLQIAQGVGHRLGEVNATTFGCQIDVADRIYRTSSRRLRHMKIKEHRDFKIHVSQGWIRHTNVFRCNTDREAQSHRIDGQNPLFQLLPVRHGATSNFGNGAPKIISIGMKSKPIRQMPSSGKGIGRSKEHPLIISSPKVRTSCHWVAGEVPERSHFPSELCSHVPNRCESKRPSPHVTFDGVHCGLFLTRTCPLPIYPAPAAVMPAGRPRLLRRLVKLTLQILDSLIRSACTSNAEAANAANLNSAELNPAPNPITNAQSRQGLACLRADGVA